ncbi:hypothetical protein [Paracoccus salsus]|uniref:hypothetical protein n=1 Tax=Paracoccus salsus TaxID=2911061 RepID=UPI001F420DDF|nr:hypothetical protein [Paracoccus salsus]MCF3972122.1 hypothetical protein [Paracoccus salsus]
MVFPISVQELMSRFASGAMVRPRPRNGSVCPPPNSVDKVQRPRTSVCVQAHTDRYEAADPSLAARVAGHAPTPLRHASKRNSTVAEKTAAQGKRQWSLVNGTLTNDLASHKKCLTGHATIDKTGTRAGTTFIGCTTPQLETPGHGDALMRARSLRLIEAAGQDVHA